MTAPVLDAVVVGSGPNGLAAAVVLARAGLGVAVLEAEDTAGGGSRTLDLGLGGLRHDLCSAVHPMALASPFFRDFDLPARGVDLLQPEIAYAQPLDGGRAGLAWRDLDRTVEGLGEDGPAWRALLGPLAENPAGVVSAALGDRRRLPSDPITAARFGLGILDQLNPRSRRFRGPVAPALLAGVAMHAIAPLSSPAPWGAGLMLAALAHSHGWPIPAGGSQAITDALLADLLAHGGSLRLATRVRRPADLPAARAYLFDTTPRTIAQVFGGLLPTGRASRLRRFRYGNAAAKVDFAIDGPVPWANPDVGLAGTVHLGGTRAQVAAAEAAVASGRHAERPAVLLSDPTVCDPGRLAGGLRPLWTYAHVPAGSTRDVTEDVTAQIERFAPGFREVVVGSRCIPAAAMSTHNENYVGGDIAAGAVTIPQMLARPFLPPNPYPVGIPGVYVCSASSLPGPGVHGLCGAYAARRALAERFGIRRMPYLGF